MLSGLILAGGRSSRMGRDKATLTLPDGRTLLQRQADILREVGVGHLMVSVRGGSNHALPGAIPVQDHVLDGGPLAGIAAGLHTAPAGLVVVLAVDMQEIQAAQLRQLVAMATAERGVVPWRAGNIEPLAAVYPTTLAASAGMAVAGPSRAVHAWVCQEAAQARLLLWEAPADWSSALRSWNTPADLPPQ